MQEITELYIYPIKSCKGISLPQTLVEEKGLKHDRRYMLIDKQGKFITGRTHPQLTQIKIEFSKKVLLINAPKQATLTIQPEQFSPQTLAAQVWSDTVQAQHCHPDYDRWFSDYLGEPCQLVYFSENSSRLVKNRNTQVSFADGYPLLLINQRSLEQLNERLDEPVSSLHFRPNIVIQGDEPFIEDSWKRIRIGEVEFEVSKACSRCTFINVNPKTGKAAVKEPLDSLSKFRYRDGEVYFGQNLIPLNQGVIRCGDPLQVLETDTPPVYGNINDANNNQGKNVDIEFKESGITVSGNNKQLLLDQAEQAGVKIPFSCRGGKCGRCKTKLLLGEVKELSQQGLFQNEIEEGYILACSSIPQSDISINH